MNKQQKDYLRRKIDAKIRSKLEAFKKDKPLDYSVAEKVSILKKAGAIVEDTYGLSYVKFAKTKEHKANQEAINKHQKEIDKLRESFIDSIELGDSKDALSLLEKFNSQLDSM